MVVQEQIATDALWSEISEQFTFRDCLTDEEFREWYKWYTSRQDRIVKIRSIKIEVEYRPTSPASPITISVPDKGVQQCLQKLTTS